MMKRILSCVSAQPVGLADTARAEIVPDVDTATPSGFQCPVDGRPMASPVVGPDGRNYDHGNVMRWLETHACLPGTTTRVPRDWAWPANHALRREIDSFSCRAAGTITAPVSTLGPVPLSPLRINDGRIVQIYVRELTGRSKSYNVGTYETVGALAELIQNRSGIPVDQQRLIYQGKQLEFGRTLADYNMTQQSYVTLVLRLRGD